MNACLELPRCSGVCRSLALLIFILLLYKEGEPKAQTLARPPRSPRLSLLPPAPFEQSVCCSLKLLFHMTGRDADGFFLKSL